MRRGASLIVWAIREGRDAARAIDQYLASKAAGRVDHDDRRILAAP
jgi:NADPH-dependent glutamate synthase beta subunit-like oxidoreductase